MRTNYTPESIISLEPNEVFVFGSNLNGEHKGGAAYKAYVDFGAKWGLAEGLSGQSYALPTLDKNFLPISQEELTKAFSRFIETVNDNPDKIFYLTMVGCGIAGMSVEFVRKALWDVLIHGFPKNLIIPREFYYEKVSSPKKRSKYGLMKMPVEVALKFANQEIGKLNSYIDEKNFEIKNLNKKLNQLTNELTTLKKKKDKCSADDTILSEEVRKIKSEEMYKNIKTCNRQLRRQIRFLRRTNVDLCVRLSKNSILQKQEVQRRLEEEENRRKDLSLRVQECRNDEEAEMLHNEITDCESSIEILKETLQKYD